MVFALPAELDAPELHLSSNDDVALVEGEDYYFDKGLMVFTANYHLRRGYCCDNGCRHCPYGEKADVVQEDQT